MKKIEIKMAKRVIDPDMRDFLLFIDMATIPYLRSGLRVPVCGVFIIVA
jgi:hypothetical protein